MFCLFSSTQALSAPGAGYPKDLSLSPSEALQLFGCMAAAAASAANPAADDASAWPAQSANHGSVSCSGRGDDDSAEDGISQRLLAALDGLRPEAFFAPVAAASSVVQRHRAKEWCHALIEQVIGFAVSVVD